MSYKPDTYRDHPARIGMSDIPKARDILSEMLAWELEDHVRDHVTRALGLMTRKSPDFVARRSLPPLTEADKEEARSLRRRGYAVHEIAQQLGTNIGRVSEAVNT